MMGVTLEDLSYQDGTFAMVAMDQRESLRTMLAEQGRPDGAAAIAAFKAAVAAQLGPLASAFLIDAGYDAPAEPGLILAVDALVQERGGPVTDTFLDRDVLANLAAEKARGVVALKLLVIWKRDGDEARRLELAREFVEVSRTAGLLSVLEPVVQPAPGEDDFDLDEAIVAAAEVLGAVQPDLYKAQVPSRGIGAATTIVKTCERITEALPVPWVVLSNGVARDDFPRAVELACTGGASGTLAGRALWTPALEVDDPTPVLAGRCRARLAEIADIVHRTARPWTAVTA
jgi:sulfofructosephosphate aldolase